MNQNAVYPEADPANHVAMGQASYSESAVRPEGSKPEAQRAESAGCVLGNGEPAPSPPVRGS